MPRGNCDESAPDGNTRDCPARSGLASDDIIVRRVTRRGQPQTGIGSSES
jgi:hypothetical protein